MNIIKNVIFKRENLIGITTFIFLLLPTLAFAKKLVPCGGEGEPDCGYNEFISLINNIIGYLLIIAAPIAAVMFAYAGWLYLTAAGKSGQIEKATGIFTTVFIGIIIALSAWLLIKLIIDTLGVNTDIVNKVL